MWKDTDVGHFMYFIHFILNIVMSKLVSLWLIGISWPRNKYQWYYDDNSISPPHNSKDCEKSIIYVKFYYGQLYFFYSFRNKTHWLHFSIPTNIIDFKMIFILIIHATQLCLLWFNCLIKHSLDINIILKIDN